MKRRIAFWNILVKDLRTYYLKPPNISWGLLFPGHGRHVFHQVRQGNGIHPGNAARAHIHLGLFGTTSMLSVAVTFEERTAPLNGFCFRRYHSAISSWPRPLEPYSSDQSTLLSPYS